MTDKITIERETLAGMIYPPKPPPRLCGYIPDGSGVEWNAYDTMQMEAYARAAYADGFAAALAAQPPDIVNPISQQEPVAWRHSETGQLYDSEEEVPLADGDEWAEPLYAAPAAQQAPAAWRQWSTKLHDWDYQTNRGDLRPDTPADPLFVAAAQLVPLTDEQRNDRIEAWSSQGWGDRLGEVVRICIAIERAHGIAAAGDKP